MMGKFRRGSVLCVVVLALVASLLPLGSTPANAQSFPAPTGLTPNGVELATNPVLRWDPVPGATRYQIELHTIPSFGSGRIALDWTWNTSYTHLAELPTDTTIYWRVRADGDDNWAVASFERKLLGPALLGPADGAVFSFPHEPPTFTWQALPSSGSYTVEIYDNPELTGTPAIGVNTTATSFTLTSNQAYDKDYYWRVRGRSTGGTGGSGGVLTEWSESRTYSTVWLQAPEPISPPDDSSIGNAVTDIELRWQPVPNARYYHLEVSLNQDFSGTPVYNNQNIYSSRFSPPATWNNASYYWRVRARDWGNNFGPWSQTFVFTRNWPAAPTLASPPNGSSIQDPVRLSWSPIPHASHYELQISEDLNFTGFSNCFTNHTEYMPYTGGSGAPGGCSTGVLRLNPGTTYYWRVRGIDAPTGVFSLWSQIQSFRRDLTYAPYVSPANGATVAVPTLEWGLVPGASQYRVRILNKNGSQVVNQLTYSNTYTPSSILPVDNSPYTWYVTVRDNDNQEGLIPNEVVRRTFNLTTPAAGATTPELTGPADGSTSTVMPAMSWTPVAGADRYEIRYSVVGSGVESVLASNLRYPAHTATGNPLPPNIYTWRVLAIDGSLILSSTVAERQFTTVSLPLGTLTAPANCTPDISCDVVTSTPVFEWDPVPNASNYLVYVALDASLTNVVRTYSVNTNRFRPREELPDNDAGQAYYWHVRPCAGWGLCSQDPRGLEGLTGQFAFQKRSSPVVLTSPANNSNWPATPADWPTAPRFEWQPYFDTNPSGTDARQYRIQVSTVPTFASTIENTLVDQPFFTPFASTYPEGPLYWRVRALDGSQNQLTWSATRVINKATPQLTLTSPTPGQAIAGSPTFSWVPQEFAARYTLEVYRNGDTAFSPTNRVVNQITTHAAFTPPAVLEPGPYAWRVRRLDGNGSKPGPWTSGGVFNVTGPAPTLTTPNNAATLLDNSILFQWSQVPGALTYRFERSNSSGFGTIAETRVTVMNSWAPITQYPDGTWFWRVTARNAAGADLGTSTTRSFTRATQDLPSIPRNVTVTNSAGRVRVNWLAPSNPGSPPFASYVITVQPGNLSRTVSAGATTTTFNGLTNGLAHTITIRARNTDGFSPTATVTGFPNGCATTPFSDVSAAHPFCQEIAWLSNTGITTGSVLGDGTVLFRPANAVTRQAMAAFMYRFDGEPPVTLTEPFFADVAPSHPFYQSIQWMAQSGLSTGSPNPPGKPLYKPNDSVSRMAMSAFLHRYAGNVPPVSVPPYFADVNASHPFFDDIQWMYQSGLSTGTPNPPGKPLYKPSDAVARQAMAAFLFRFDELVGG